MGKTLMAHTLLAIAMMGSPTSGLIYPSGTRPKFRERVKKNKYNLTSEEIQYMETLSSKEKKKFLKSKVGDL